jgi:hypothetical protein
MNLIKVKGADVYQGSTIKSPDLVKKRRVKWVAFVGAAINVILSARSISSF